MDVKEIMTQLESFGDANIKKILMKHGVREPFFGVKIGHLKTIQKKIKKDYQLANQLYATHNADAMYLAGLIADDEKMTKADLQKWVKAALSINISEYTVPWVAAGSKYGLELATEWINSKEEHIAAAGWATLSGLVALRPDEELNIPALKKLLTHVEKNIQTAKDRERYAMNNFIISVGTYITDLTKDAIATATKIGTITVDMNDSACKVPSATEYINKAIAKGNHGKKKKTIKC